MKSSRIVKISQSSVRVGILVIFCFLIDMLISRQCFAWGPGVHTVIALRSLDAADRLLSSISNIIFANPLEYLYGSLAADFFLMKGHLKSTRHAHHWKGGFTLLEEANEEGEKAYAYGFLAHLAADVIAHNIFIPNLVNIFPSKRRGAHLSWEVRADYIVGPQYTRIAKEVLSTDQEACDEILRSVSSKKRNGLKTRKKLYTQSVKLSDYLYEAIPSLFRCKTVRWEGFKEYTLRTVVISSFFVIEFLQNPFDSICLKYDPNGVGRLKKTRPKGFLTRILKPRRPYLPMRDRSRIFRI